MAAHFAKLKIDDRFGDQGTARSITDSGCPIHMHEVQLMATTTHARCT